MFSSFDLKGIAKVYLARHLSSSGPITVSITSVAFVVGVKWERRRKNKGAQEREERARRGK